MLSISLKMIKKQCPGLKLIVSYADPNQCHLGKIYQADNWVFVGESSIVVQYYFRNQWRNDSSLMRFFKNNPGIKEKLLLRNLLPKFKYIYPLTRQMRKQILPLAKPYPQQLTRVTSKEGVAIPIQGIEAGSNPSVTL
jgi:hypothetical protein